MERETRLLWPRALPPHLVCAWRTCAVAYVPVRPASCPSSWLCTAFPPTRGRLGAPRFPSRASGSVAAGEDRRQQDPRQPRLTAPVAWYVPRLAVRRRGGGPGPVLAGPRSGCLGSRAPRLGVLSHVRGDPLFLQPYLGLSGLWVGTRVTSHILLTSVKCALCWVLGVRGCVPQRPLLVSS